MRTLLADGNFKQEHLKMKYPEDDVPLSDGHGYMVGKKDFDHYIDKAPAPASQVCRALLVIFRCLRAVGFHMS